MTWIATIVAKGVKTEELGGVCYICKHQSTCQVTKVSHNISAFLTAIDTGCDGHMASGDAELTCHGFESSIPDSTDEDADNNESMGNDSGE